MITDSVLLYFNWVIKKITVIVVTFVMKNLNYGKATVRNVVYWNKNGLAIEKILSKLKFNFWYKIAPNR